MFSFSLVMSAGHVVIILFVFYSSFSPVAFFPISFVSVINLWKVWFFVCFITCFYVVLLLLLLWIVELIFASWLYNRSALNSSMWLFNNVLMLASFSYMNNLSHNFTKVSPKVTDRICNYFLSFVWTPNIYDVTSCWLIFRENLAKITSSNHVLRASNAGILPEKYALT